jgi:TonB-dependent SusC/RagA subfamily outer membrane receptor
LLNLYCRYRIESFNTVKKSLTDGMYDYQPWISHYDEKIQLIIEKLSGEIIHEKQLELDLPPLEQTVRRVFVVDGIVVDNIGYLQPNDIKRMDVLKGEAATSLYGERARDGAVLVTTRGAGE